jgi:hypothetical protein
MHLKSQLSGVGRKAAAQVKKIVQSGLTPQKLSLTISLGSAIGMMPLLWGTTLLSALLAALFRLNQAAMQAVNYLCYPLQIVLFIPFCRLGEAIFPWGPRVSVVILSSALHGHLGTTLSLIGWASARAVGAWLLVAPPFILCLYPLLKRLFLSREKRAVADQSR